MIVNTYTDREILEELLTDYEEVQAFLKKYYDKFKKEHREKGKQDPLNQLAPTEIITHKKNTWKGGILFQNIGSAAWRRIICCVVKDEKGNDNYYILRNVKEHPYYIHFTPHAAHRLFERSGFINFEDDVSLYIAKLFQPGEILFGIKYLSYEDLVEYYSLDPEERPSDVSNIFVANVGYFFGDVTENNNYIFRTYINAKQASDHFNLYGLSEKMKQNANILFLRIIHQYYNQKLYSKEALDNLLYKTYGPNPKLEIPNTYMQLKS